MSQILNMSQHTTDEELHRLTTMLLFHLVERCGGGAVQAGGCPACAQSRD